MAEEASRPSRSQDCTRAMSDVLMSFSLAGGADREYEKARDCKPPPIFIPLISCIQVGLFIYYAFTMAPLTASGPVPRDSVLTYSPIRRREVWRLFSYMFIHAGWLHITNNLIFQLLIGIPLETVHKIWRVGPIYVLGVLAGSLATSVTDSNIFLVGASAGVYALIAAHLADVIMNWNEMSSFKGIGRIIRVVFIALYAIFDIAVAVYYRHFAPTTSESRHTGYAAHVGGAIAGLLLGIVLLRNLEKHAWETVLFWIALALAIVLFVFAILWNIFYPGFLSQEV